MTTHFIDEAGLIALTQDLVRLETLSGEEGPAIQRTRRAFEALGFTQIHEDELGNVTGTIRGDLPGPTLLFDAHVDTVGIAPGVPWTVDPFGAESDFGRRMGRRTWALRGALAAPHCQWRPIPTWPTYMTCWRISRSAAPRWSAYRAGAVWRLRLR